MKLKLLFGLLALIPASLYAQNKNDEKFFLDSLKLETKEKNHVYYRIVKDYKLEKVQYQIEEYYKSGNLMTKGFSSDKDIIIRDGVFTTYYENGTKKSTEYFIANRRTGEYSSWYENGNKKAEGIYVLIGDNEETVLKIDQFWNAENIQMVKDGDGLYEEVESDGTELKGNLKNGLKIGQWNGIGPKSEYTFKESYRNGKFVAGESIINQNKVTYTKIHEVAGSKLGLTDFSAYILKNLSLDGIDLPAYYLLKIYFIIDKNGNVSNINVDKSKYPKIEKRAFEAIKGYKNWQPAKSRGMLANSVYIFPIRLSSTYKY